MRPLRERQIVNGRRSSKEERERAEQSRLFLEEKYRCARKIFWVLWRLMLYSHSENVLFGPTYLADRLTQKHTFGTYDQYRPERGSRMLDPNSVCDCPTWFSKSMEVDSH